MHIGIKRVILFVEDVPKLTEFYEKKLGLKVALRTPEFVDFEAGACHLALHQGMSRPRADEDLLLRRRCLEGAGRTPGSRDRDGQGSGCRRRHQVVRR